MNNQIVIIVGPTAVGKTEYAIKTAENLDGEIVSADSMQIYKYMNIGSAKPTKEELSRVKHYLVDEIDPGTPWSVAEYQRLAKKYINDILINNKLPIVSGGTGLYVNSIIYDMDFSEIERQTDLRDQLEKDADTYGNRYVHDMLYRLDPEAAERIHPNNLKKIIRAIEVARLSGHGIPQFSKSFRKTNDYDCIIIGLIRDRKILYERIEKRVDLLIEAGLFEEVGNLLRMGLSEDSISMKGIGYKEIIGCLKGEYDRDEAIRLIKRNTRRYAKRQITWFKRYPDIKWFEISNEEKKDETFEAIIAYLEEVLSFKRIVKYTDMIY